VAKMMEKLFFLSEISSLPAKFSGSDTLSASKVEGRDGIEGMHDHKMTGEVFDEKLRYHQCSVNEHQLSEILDDLDEPQLQENELVCCTITISIGFNYAQSDYTVRSAWTSDGCHHCRNPSISSSSASNWQ
jgi:hypothetical protein